MRGIKDLPQALLERFEQIGDIIHFAEICDASGPVKTCYSL
jgi:hypothetical protein